MDSPPAPIDRRCALTECMFCTGPFEPCAYCRGTGVWSAERPTREESGSIGWEDVIEECRICTGTGRHHDPERLL
ncbi:DnaJ-class molecular chaperone [Nocardiopsis mwathae]|uniref:DnaJ-class molecular chaperone n=1 Tax=Nocardiopsis mwathae TaxID=1472723 RepID=A0A7X0D7D5_9ACTN|nr:DnaJ-class molecular chaperone [Nocardiopsis mwathae]